MNDIINKIIELLQAGEGFDFTRDFLCQKYNLTHSMYKHYYISARAKMKKEGET